MTQQDNIQVQTVKIPEQQMVHDREFPLVYQGNLTNQNKSLAKGWFQSNKDEILKKLGLHGAVLLRGFGLENADDFYDFLTVLEFKYGSYIGGGGPRNVIKGPIHTSTETPANLEIPFHHELAYLNKYPGKLSFFCETPAKERGYTPILSSNRVYERVLKENESFVKKLKEKKVRYVRVVKDKANCDQKRQRSWQEIFYTDSKEEAEKKAKEVGHEKIEWLEDGSMKLTSEKMEAVREDPRTKQFTWFNSIVLLHPASQGMDKASSPWCPVYGDYSDINDEDIVHASKVMKEEGIMFPYVKGDILLVDNMLALHARTTFTPPRLVLAAIME